MDLLTAIAAVLPQAIPVFLLWITSVNILSFTLFGIDKHLAKRRERRPRLRRIPEKTLFLFALLGGGIGALLGMRVWRHKTLHRSFRLGIPLILCMQLALAGWLLGSFLY